MICHRDCGHFYVTFGRINIPNNYSYKYLCFGGLQVKIIRILKHFLCVVVNFVVNVYYFKIIQRNFSELVRQKLRGVLNALDGVSVSMIGVDT